MNMKKVDSHFRTEMKLKYDRSVSFLFTLYHRGTNIQFRLIFKFVEKYFIFVYFLNNEIN